MVETVGQQESVYLSHVEKMQRLNRLVKADEISDLTLDAMGKPIAGRKFTVEVMTFELIPLTIQEKIKGINKGYQRITNCENICLCMNDCKCII